MKKRIQSSGCSKTGSLVCLLAMLFIPYCLRAQTSSREPLAGSIQCSIQNETEIWSRDKSIPVMVKISNTANKPINLVGIYALELTGIGESNVAKGAQYWGPVDIRDGTPLRLQPVEKLPAQGIGGGKVPELAIELGPAESKTLTLYVDKLFWNLSIYSDWPHRDLFDAVPRGTYDLIFDIETERRKDSTGDPVVTHIKSNRVTAIIH